MTTPAERLSAAIHLESAAIAPQTSALIEAAKEVLAENERLRGELMAAAGRLTWCASANPGVRCESGQSLVHGWAEEMRNASQQLSVNSEEGK